ncbi:formyltransferase family protein [Verrucomicrobia bacterium]|nr:formyltransferase family protein [Verrucomicrobiota bacterium]
MRTVILGYFNNIYAVETALRCRKKGIEIDAFIFQGDTPRELNERVRMERTPKITAPRICDVQELQVPCYFVKDANSETATNLLKKLNVDVILQGMGPIYRKNLIDTAKVGVLNSHPGLLPDYAGCNAVEWSLYNDDPVGSTCHFIDEGIDSGPIITSSSFDVEHGDTYETIRMKSFYHEIDTLVLGLQKVLNGLTFDDAETQGEGHYYKVMDKHKLDSLHEKIKAGGYKHTVS